MGETMKIGIVTWYKNGNYGGTLQAYALMKILQNIGYEVEFFNYDSGNKLIAFIRHKVFNLKYYHSGKSRKAIWSFVHKELNETPVLNNINDVSQYSSENFDAVICGSDQIWSSLNGVSQFYFLQFDNPKKRIAYAPSIGLNKIKDEYLGAFAEYVSSIPFLSVRETQGAEYIESVTGRNAEIVLDPSLLIDKKGWYNLMSIEVLKRHKLTKGKYILCYFLGDDSKYHTYVDKISAKTGLRVVFVSSGRKEYGKQHIVCDPAEFVGLIASAAYVLTDSYHGTIFSVNTGTKVGIFRRFLEDDVLNQNSRIYSIVSLLGLEKHLINYDDSVDALMSMDEYSPESVQKLKILRESSLQFLITSLEVATRKN